MATKNLARTVVEGGRDTYSKLYRKLRKRSERRLRFDVEGDVMRPGARVRIQRFRAASSGVGPDDAGIVATLTGAIRTHPRFGLSLLTWPPLWLGAAGFGWRGRWIVGSKPT